MASGHACGAIDIDRLRVAADGHQCALRKRALAAAWQNVRLSDTGEAEIPGREVEFDPEEAERIAFREDALSDEDARESAADL